MDIQKTRRRKRALQALEILKSLSLYVLAPLILLIFLVKPIGDAVRQSDASAWWILLAVLGAVCLNWLVYILRKKKRPSILVFADGVMWLLAVLIVEYASLPAYVDLSASLVLAGTALTLTFLFLMGYWGGARRTRTARVTVTTVRCLLGLLLFGMGYQIIRDFEIEHVTRDTWITVFFMAAVIAGFNVYGIISSIRNASLKHRTTGSAEGTIVQIIGETDLDNDGDYVTKNHVRIQYSVDGADYETRADISRFTTRYYGRKAFIGKKVPVAYNPENPAETFMKKIDKRIFDLEENKEKPKEEAAEEPDGESAEE